ncbi:MAG: sensor histidine kinase [Acidobacteria bacterium]|nr:MAG: sensor histidine kinase [Acidobacteriota bacterium]
MSDEKNAWPGGFRLALRVAAVALAGLTTAVALWGPLDYDRRDHVNRLTSQTLASIRADLEADVSSLILGHIRLAREWGWEEPGEALTSGEWMLNAQLFLEHHPQDIGLQLLDTAGNIVWASHEGLPQPKSAAHGPAPAAAAQPAAGTALAKAGDSASLTSSFPLAGGRRGMGVTVPVLRDGRPYGYLAAVFDVEATLDLMLSDHRNQGHWVEVYEGAERLYVTPGATADGERPFVQEANMAFAGARLRVAVWPKAGLLAHSRSALPELAAALGGLLGSALLLTLHFAHASHSRSRELREGRDRLEVSVAERTAELKRVNADLECEVAERKRAEESLRNLSGRLLRLQDEERRRIARELHDSTTQLLGASAIHIGEARQMAIERRQEELATRLGQSMESLERVRLDIRTVSYLLHPPILDELGLEYVLPWYVEGFSQRSGITVNLYVQPDLGRLPQEVEMAFFRITQEALTNVHRHSGSKTAGMTLFRDGSAATLTISDEGHGVPAGILDPPGKANVHLGVGIQGMRERVRQLGGTLGIESGPRGTTVQVVLPIPSEYPPALTHPNTEAPLSPGVTRPSRASAHGIPPA